MGGSGGKQGSDQAIIKIIIAGVISNFVEQPPSYSGPKGG